MIRPSITRPVPSVQQEIKDAAWRQVAATGNASISLNGIARELKVTNEELSRYFADLDALLTAMFIDAYSSFGDYQIIARDSFPGIGQFLQRFMAIGLAYREWALRYPERYLFIFGSPVPGFHPPLEILRPFMMRSNSSLVGVIRELRAVKLLNIDSMPVLEQSAFDGYFPSTSSVSKEELLIHTLAMVIRSRIHGMVSLEITGQLPLYGEAGSLLYEFEIKSIVRQFVDI